MMKALFNVPNTISYVRILIIPSLVILLAMMRPDSGMELAGTYWIYCVWATILFSLAGVSDLVDGYYARKYGAVSTIGKFIDPMADKLIHMAVMVMLIPLGRIPAWVVVVLLFREIFISGVRAAAAAEGLIIDAADWGKKKTVWLNFGLGCLIYYYPLAPGKPWSINVYGLGIICLSIGFVYSIASAVAYTQHFIKTIKK